MAAQPVDISEQMVVKQLAGMWPTMVEANISGSNWWFSRLILGAHIGCMFPAESC